ncbi:MAG: ice-binding family protein, partial [Desulfuromonadales bacterium]|nr:ice-binding family protein [Desulfuromonadales bacterium]
TTGPTAACNLGINGTFQPGLYWSGTNISIPVGGTITLDAMNDPNAVFIFQSESTIITNANSHIILANLANANNVFWVAKSSATIGGTGADFAGTVLALEDFTVNEDTQMLGRALARNGNVTVQDLALITVPTP